MPNWIGRSAARLQAVSREEPYRVRLAQVPATASDALYQQILHHIQTATRSEDRNRLQLVELTYAFCAEEVLRADPRGLGRLLASIQLHASNPQLATAIRAQLATTALDRQYPVHAVGPEIVPPRSSREVTVGLGSAIFLHINIGIPTAGCVTVPEGELLEILRWLNPAASPQITMGVG